MGSNTMVDGACGHGRGEPDIRQPSSDANAMAVSSPGSPPSSDAGGTLCIAEHTTAPCSCVNHIGLFGALNRPVRVAMQGCVVRNERLCGTKCRVRRRVQCAGWSVEHRRCRDWDRELHEASNCQYLSYVGMEPYVVQPGNWLF